jgi:hypothetical protein
MGVIIGLAGIKFSGSLNILGFIKFNNIYIIKVIINPIKSLVVKYG